MATPSTYSKRFVGRTQQLQLLRERFRAAEKGEGSVVIIAGEAGAGKTRLVSEFCTPLPEHGTRLAVGRCLEYIQSPYAPFLAVLRALVSNDPTVLAAAPHIKTALAHLIPELQPRADAPLTQPPDKLRQFNLMAEALQRFGGDRAAVAVIEDLHWADSGTLEVLQHWLPFVATCRVLLIVTFRSDSLSRDHPLRSTLAKLERDRHVFRSDLEPLDNAQMHSLIFHALDSRDALPPAIINTICVRAEGNPLFAEELLKAALIGADRLEGHLPTTLQEAVQERFRRFSKEERFVLVNAAAIGRRFQVEFLAQILAAPVEQITPTLRRALELDLIAEERNGVVQYRFRHALQRQAIYGELLATEAQRLHAKIARALEASNADEHAAELAYHCWQARESEKAARYNEMAGDAAFSVFAYGDALVNYERALQCGVAQGARRAELSLKLAAALHQNGLGERAKEATLWALGEYEAVGDKERAAQVCLRLSALSVDLGDTTSANASAERALNLIGADRTNPIFYEAHVEMMALNVFHWNIEQARVHMNQALLFTGTPMPAARIRFLQMKTAIEACSGNSQQALDDTTAAGALAEASRDFRRACSGWMNFAYGMALIGERDLAIRGFGEALRVVREQHISGLTPSWLSIHFADACLHHGDLQKARELVEQALASGIDTLRFRLNIALPGVLVGLRLELPDLIDRCMNPGLVEYALESSAAEVFVFAELYADQGRQDDARALLHRALNKLQSEPSKLGLGGVDKFLVSVARFGGDEDALQARDALQRVAGLLRIRSIPACLALVDAYINARTTDGSRAGENATAHEAARLFHDIGWPHYEAQALELAGQHEEALAIYREIGDVHDARRLEVSLTPINRRGRGKSELTARENEVLDILVTGRSNRSIAEALVISERTVENHVSSILAKVGADSRSALIAKFREKTAP